MKSFLELIKEEKILHPSNLMPRLQKHIDEIVNQQTFKGEPLVIGWKVVKEDSCNDHWIAREEVDCQEDFSVFMKDLTKSIDQRYLKCVPQMCHELLCFDFENIIALICGSRIRGKVSVENITALENYGKDGFFYFLSYACNLDHIKHAIVEGILDLEPEISHVLHRQFKMFIHDIVWNHKEVMCEWFSSSCTESKKIQPLREVMHANSGCLLQLKKVYKPNMYKLEFECTFNDDEKKYNVVVNEDKIIESMYKDPSIYTKAGKEICVLLDLALSKGGPEAVVESFYSVMKNHKMNGGQHNDNLAMRAKLDWCLPNSLQATRMVEEVAAIYLKGDKTRGLKSHILPVIGNKTRKVLTRLEQEDVKLPFIL